jgi:LuxR family transcriptional regulator of csgAB operon
MAEQAASAALARSVLIVGPASLQNRILARLIEKRTGCACSIRSSESMNGARASLALLDVGEASTHAASLCASGAFESIALINVGESLPVDYLVSCPGVKGVFFVDTSEDALVKGLEAIFRGEYWLPRKVLWAHLERTRTEPRSVSPEAALLTRKELETLKLLATGNSNEGIAQVLKVSPHTVKTHLYNLFRKIRVNSRLQAVHWAAKNLVIAETQPPR